MKDIMLRIIGSQIVAGLEPGEINNMEFVTEGRFYTKGNSVYLVYDESDFSGVEGCTTSLKITGNKIRMKRYGEDAGIASAIVFEKGKRFSGFVDTPLGSVPLEVLTNDVENKIEDGKGALDIDYNVSLKGLTEGRSKLKIEIM